MLFCLTGAIAQAQTYTWTATSGLFTDSANWLDNSLPTSTLEAREATAINFTNGTSSAPVETFFNVEYDTRNVTIGEHNTMTLNDKSKLTAYSESGVFTNHGLIQTSTGTSTLQRFQGSSVNTGEIRAVSGSTLNWVGPTVNNTGGLVVAKSGSVIQTDSTSATVTNGTVQIDSGATFYVGLPDTGNVQQKINFTGVAIANSGDFVTRQAYTASSPDFGDWQVQTNLNSGTQFSNAAGANLSVTATAGGTPAEGRTGQSSVFYLNSGATFTNEGTISILNDTSREAASLTKQSSTFDVKEGASFTTTGTIEVINDSLASSATAAFTSAESLTNQGIVHVRGNAANAGASFTVTGASNTFTQAGGINQRTVLERGAMLSASGGIFINSGTLGGVGTVTDATTLNSGATLIAGDSLSSGIGAGELHFDSHLTFESGSSVKFGIGSDTTNSGRVVLGTGADLWIGETASLSLLDLGNASSGTYRLFQLSNTGTVISDFDGFVLGSMPVGWSAELLTENEYIDLVLTVTAVPEPTTYALMAGLASMAWVAGGRRRGSRTVRS